MNTQVVYEVAFSLFIKEAAGSLDKETAIKVAENCFKIAEVFAEVADKNSQISAPEK